MMKIFDTETLESELATLFERTLSDVDGARREPYTKAESCALRAIPLLVGEHIAKRVELRLQAIEATLAERAVPPSLDVPRLADAIGPAVMSYVDRRLAEAGLK